MSGYINQIKRKLPALFGQINISITLMMSEEPTAASQTIYTMIIHFTKCNNIGGASSEKGYMSVFGDFEKTRFKV